MKKLDIDSIEIDGIDTRDYPDFSDSFACFALWEDGTELTEQELDEIDRNIIYDKVWKHLI